MIAYEDKKYGFVGTLNIEFVIDLRIMPIPDYQTIMLPLLKFAGDKQEHSLQEAISYLANQFNLTEAERKELLPSGKQFTFHNRVGWARTYLKKAGLLSSSRRSYFQITLRGIEVLAQNPQVINVNFLAQYDEFIQFRQLNKKNSNNNLVQEDTEKNTPEEILENAYQKLQENLSIEILETIKQCSPEFFESLVVDLLVSMGYGGSRKEAGQAVGHSGDGGIDGIIKEDRLGLDIIYIQAKRWENVVGRPEIQKFAGALQGQRAKKGVFIATSCFTKDAIEYVSRIDTKIILVDGNRLTELMIEHNVGVTSIAKYEVKRIDSDYFTED
ncbi:mrr restriction system protein [Stanieria sp. NIES-3757]|nr:mrr restriction system protein [Stanieria sp. NIES-3757]